MLDQLLASVKDQAVSQLTSSTGLDASQAAAAVPLAGESVSEGLMGALTSGGLDKVSGLLSGFSGGGSSSLLSSNPLASGIVGNLVTKLTGKLGIGEGMASTAATMLIPMLLSKIGGAAKDAGDSDELDMSSIMGVLGGGGGGLMDQAKGMLGGAAGNMLGGLMGK